MFNLKRNPEPSANHPCLAAIGLVLIASLNTAYAQNDPSIAAIKPLSPATLAPVNSLQVNNSQANSLAAILIQKAKQQKLAMHPTWLRLHYYIETVKGEAQHYQSKVDKLSFFVSANGVNSPQDELEAFIKKLVHQNIAGVVDHNNKDNVACRFPARTHWLTTQLDVNAIDPNCPDFEGWMQQLDPQRLSVVFAEPYPDKAVSAFGHTLMLIDSQASLADPAAINKAHALNVTVGGDADDGLAVFTAKSIAGGYPNEITIDPYPTKLSEYLQKDNRDVWTYALNLTRPEVQQIMRHVWETKDLNLPYYFTLDNCASEILRYIDMVRPESHLLAAFNVAIVPADVVQLLDKKGLITKESYFPADKTLAQAQRNNAQLNGLPNSSISTATKLVSAQSISAQLDANNRPKSTNSQRKTTDSHKLLLTNLTPADNNVLNAHARQRVMAGVGLEGNNGYLSLAYRGGFHGPLDLPSGYPQNFHLETGSLDMRLYEDNNNDVNSRSPSSPSHSKQNSHSKHDRIELQDLTIMRGRSLHPINSARAGDSLLSSWGINLQVTQVIDASQVTNTSHLVGNIAFEKGLAMAFGTPTVGTGEVPPNLCYGLGTGMAQVGKGLNNGYRVGAGVNVGCRYLLNNRARITGELQLPYWYHGNMDTDSTHANYWQPTLTLGVQYDIDKNQSIRVQGSHQFQDRINNNSDINVKYINYF